MATFPVAASDVRSAEPSDVQGAFMQNRLRWLDGAVLLSLTALVLYTVSKHEPWADEAQAWLQARDFNWWHLVFTELHYEGHPPVWFAILAVAVHVFHVPYAFIGYLGASFAIAGLAVLVYLAPFPRSLRYLIAFSFFLVYQYAVIARPYVLIPLLAFLAAHFARNDPSHILTFAVLAALLIHVSAYSAVIAMGLSAFCALHLSRGWAETSPTDRTRILGAAALVSASAVLALVLLYPHPDSAFMTQKVDGTLQYRLHLMGQALVGSLDDSALVAYPLLLFAVVWACCWRGFLPLLTCVGGTAMVYGFLRGYEHHQGLLTVALVVSLWVAWPSPSETETAPRIVQWLHRSFVIALLLLFAWQCTWSYTAIRNEWADPYSGAQDAAAFLKSVHADQLGCAGYLYWVVGVQPYFQHNLFQNWGGPDAPASYHWAKDFQKRSDGLLLSDAVNGPPFIVIANEFQDLQHTVPLIQSMKSVNYNLVHSSPGNKFFKGKKGVYTWYLVFAKTGPPAALPNP